MGDPPPGWTVYYGDNSTHRPDHISWQHPVVWPDLRWPIRYGRLSTTAGRKVWYSVGSLCVATWYVWSPLDRVSGHHANPATRLLCGHGKWAHCRRVDTHPRPTVDSSGTHFCYLAYPVLTSVTLHTFWLPSCPTLSSPCIHIR